MNTSYRHILEPYKGPNTRYHCPSCQQRKKTFSRYIDTLTGQHIDSTVGRCNRESSCGYHYTPKQYFNDNKIQFEKPTADVQKKVNLHQIPISYIPMESFKDSLRRYDSNNFVNFLINHFGIEIARHLVNQYFIATAKYWKGATVFWQVDILGNIRTGKIMLYNPTTGKRVKDLELPVNWVHKALKLPKFSLKQCLFGEHLLIDNTKPVAIVESEKTAIVASVYLPQFIWVAVGGRSNLNVERCSILKGRKVCLFPDSDGYSEWNKRLSELSKITMFTISDLLERRLTEMEKDEGLDIADYLLMKL